MDFTERVQRRHVRFHQSGLPYHIISKTNNGAFFLAPKPGIRELCAGVLAKGQQKYPHLKVYGFAFMSNHIHLMVSGSSFDIPEFMGFLKREISRRIGFKYDLKGPKWQRETMSERKLKPIAGYENVSFTNRFSVLSAVFGVTIH